MKRRTFLIGSAAAVVAGTMLKPEDNGQPYQDYFSGLNSELKTSGKYLPTMLVDLDRLDKNITTLDKQLNPKAELRIVAKSLPSPELLSYIMEKAETNKLMVFHQPFINHIANEFPDADMLVGKPMPVKAAERFYHLFSEQALQREALTRHPPENNSPESKFKHELQLQWLIDNPQRAEQYLALAKKLNIKMQLNIELDVGLHRGGLKTLSELDEILALVEANSQFIQFSGFMGYDPHVVKLPSLVKSAEQAYLESQAIYQSFIEHLYETYPKYKDIALVFNGAGSPTIAMHQAKTVCNELSAGSCLVKPTDFDIPSLASYQAAAFIATPVLKKMSGTELPAAEVAKNIFPIWDPNMQQTFFIYGGKWLASYESPKGLQGNDLFGTSTNQQIVNASYKVQLDVDDHIFLRPAQSEFVFLQFGNIATVRDSKLVSYWPILKQV